MQIIETEPSATIGEPSNKEAKSSGEPGWKWRRMVIFPVVAFACWQLHLLRGNSDTQVNQMVASGWMWLVGVLVVSYAGFATFQDVVAIWRTGTALPYAPNTDSSKGVK